MSCRTVHCLPVCVHLAPAATGHCLCVFEPSSTTPRYVPPLQAAQQQASAQAADLARQAARHASEVARLEGLLATGQRELQLHRAQVGGGTLPRVAAVSKWQCLLCATCARNRLCGQQCFLHTQALLPAHTGTACTHSALQVQCFWKLPQADLAHHSSSCTCLPASSATSAASGPSVQHCLLL